MKTHYYIITLVALSLACAGVNAQSSNQNYILTRTMTNDAGTNSMNEIQYFDGLGRPVQTVQKNFGPQGQDIVDYREYDEYGRESKNYLPVVLSAGNFGYFVPLSNIKNLSTQVYQNDTKAYSETVYEASPLNRVVREYGPGQAWNPNSGTGGKPVATNYLTNSATTDYLRCINYSVSGTNLTRSGYYASGQLYVTETTDEDGNKSYEFKDKLGQVLLIRQIDKTKTGVARLHDTYYVYDDFGQKRFVLPPRASEILLSSSYPEDNQTIKDYAYIYKYDRYGRCIEEKTPGCAPVYMAYDKANRLVATQNGEQRNKYPQDWTMNIYDDFGRLVISGIYTPDYYIPAIVMQDYTFSNAPLIASKGNGPYGYVYNYSNELNVLLVNYYDDYNFPGKIDYEVKTGYNTQYVNSSCTDCSAKGLLTGTLVKMLDDSNGANPMPFVTTEIKTTFYYDDKGRMIQKKSNNHINGSDNEYIAYNFTGQETKKLLEHSSLTPSMQMVNISETYTYTYDHANRLTETKYKIDNRNEISLSRLVYDNLGRLSGKILNSGMETVNYTYNIRNWTKGIDSKYFKQTLYYADSYSGSTPLYNGNISALSWQNYNYTPVRGYHFTYDGLNRLTQSRYLLNNSYSTSNNLNEEMGYDKMGNVTYLRRTGNAPATGIYSPGITIDDLILTYSGNQLKKVTENAMINNVLGFTKAGGTAEEEYRYNLNGSLTQDLNRGIAGIKYNWLNLPRRIQFTYGHSSEYTYDASGVKRKVYHVTVRNNLNVPMGTTTATNQSSYISSIMTNDYCGHIIYENNQVKQILTPEGYLTKIGASYDYHFYLRDHLGNNRSVLKWDGAGNSNTDCAVVQETNYYPSGMEYERWYPGDSYNPGTQSYKYGDKELQDMHGLKWYDYDARHRDNFIPVFTTRDPLAHEYPNISPYAYCANNPLKYIDPDGEKFLDFLVGIVHSIGKNLTIGLASTNTGGVSNANHYNAGRDVGDVVSMAMGTAETIVGTAATGGGTAATVATAGVGSPVTVPVAAAGVGMAIHGAAVTGTAAKNLATQEGRMQASSRKSSSSSTNSSNDKLINSAKESQAKKAASADRAAKRDAQTVRGNNRTGNSNQDIKGSHNTNNRGGDTHSNGNARRARDQKVKGPDDTK